MLISIALQLDSTDLNDCKLCHIYTLAHIVWGLYKENPLLSMFGSFGFMLQSIIDILMVYPKKNKKKPVVKFMLIVCIYIFLFILTYIFIKKSLQLRI